MVAIIGAVLFGLALLFQLAGIAVPVLTADVLITAGLLCVALHLAGIGTTRRTRSRTSPRGTTSPTPWGRPPPRPGVSRPER